MPAPLAPLGWLPMLGINMGCGFLSAAFGDAVCQRIEYHFGIKTQRRKRRNLRKERRGSYKELDAADSDSDSSGEDAEFECDCSRALSMACSIGFVIAPVSFVWYTYAMPHLATMPQHAPILVKLRHLPRMMFFDLVVYGGPWAVMLSASNAAWQIPDCTYVCARVKSDTWPVWWSQAALWGPIDIPVFLLMPLWMVAPFYKVFGSVYMIWVSFITHRDTELVEEACQVSPRVREALERKGSVRSRKSSSRNSSRNVTPKAAS
eukprot:Hpha_TRINITY_DN26085_c0_g1::TRINITY_DN26085_c0_g1_i1::g.115114::m.115114